MVYQEKKMEIQKKLFEAIRKNLPSQYVLVDVISDVLKVGLDSAYRRIRCDKFLNINETYTLCKQTANYKDE
jgi:Tfp pilus assembly protein PilO